VAGVGWGAAAGLAGVVGRSLLYQGLAIGRMSVVAEPEGGLEGRVKKIVTSRESLRRMSHR
jgi:hypothetical protein